MKKSLSLSDKKSDSKSLNQSDWIKENLKLTCSVIIDDIIENWDNYTDSF